jgi:hypothetical protein
LGLKKEAVLGDSTNLYNNLYCSLNIIRLIQNKGDEIGGDMARKGEKRNVWCRGGEGDLNKTNHVEDLSTDGRKTKWNLTGKDRRAWTRIIWLRTVHRIS